MRDYVKPTEGKNLITPGKSKCTLWQKSLNLEVATPAIVPEMAHSAEFLYQSTALMPVTEHTASVGICGQDDNALFRPRSTTGE
jgi:hypothetical protein